MYELCPYCNFETYYDVDEAIANNGIVTCQDCGKKIKACAICKFAYEGCNWQLCAVQNQFVYCGGEE